MSENEASVPDAVVAAAGAVSDLAKLADKSSGFLHRVIGGSLEQIGGMFDDWLRVKRMERVIKLEARVLELQQVRQSMGRLQPVSEAFALPLLGAASLTDDPDLSEMFARLLANAIDPDRSTGTRTAFVRMVQEMEPIDAQIFGVVFSYLDDGGGELRAVTTGGLPESVELFQARNHPELTPPSARIQIALRNLIRLEILGSATTYGGGSTTDIVVPTALGWALYRAIN